MPPEALWTSAISPASAAALDETGVFEATVAVFGNVDKGGDRILPGAFAKSLDKWRQVGDPIPVIFNHEWSDAHAHIGTADPRQTRETARGLLVKGRLDVEDNPTAAQVYRLMKRRSLKEFSFGYTVPPGGIVSHATARMNCSRSRSWKSGRRSRA